MTRNRIHATFLHPYPIRANSRVSRATSPFMNFLKPVLWGNTVALSWMWGLGLFFSVQFTQQFGILGLLMFAIPNFLGLMAFGLVTQIIANRQPGTDSLNAFFTTWSRPFRLVFFLYQLLAITLTIFAFIHYVWQPLGLQPAVLFLPLTLLIILAAAVLFGEEFDIRRIKYSHGVLFAIALVAILVLIFGRDEFYNLSSLLPGRLPADDLSFWGYVVPITIGFLVGPWLDLQQEKGSEKGSVRALVQRRGQSVHWFRFSVFGRSHICRLHF